MSSRLANAYVTEIDASAALAMPGVVAVYGPDDVPHNRFTLAGQSFLEPSPYDTVLLDRHVRYVGDEVAMVVATDERTAAAAVFGLHIDPLNKVLRQHGMIHRSHIHAQGIALHRDHRQVLLAGRVHRVGHQRLHFFAAADHVVPLRQHPDHC